LGDTDRQSRQSKSQIDTYITTKNINMSWFNTNNQQTIENKERKKQRKRKQRKKERKIERNSDKKENVVQGGKII
jgi:hypothetical protein